MRWLFVAVNGMSLSLGMLLMMLLDSWIRGQSDIWWLALVLLTLFSVVVSGFTVMMRIK